MPGLTVGLLGPLSMAAMVLGGAFAFLVALCFAEVGGRFSQTGGAYRFAREALGDLVGFATGWMQAPMGTAERLCAAVRARDRPAGDGAVRVAAELIAGGLALASGLPVYLWARRGG